MAPKSVTDILGGDHVYIIDDVMELCDVLEFYPSEGDIDPQAIAGQVAVVLASPQLLSTEWDGCILLSINGNRCKLPFAALDMSRVYEGEEVEEDVTLTTPSAGRRCDTDDRSNELAGDDRSTGSDTPMKNIPVKNIFEAHSSPKTRNRWNDILSPSSSAAIKKVFFGHDAPPAIEGEIMYVRDTSSEAVMIRQLAAESIQDAYRRYKACQPAVKLKRMNSYGRDVMNFAAETIKTNIRRCASSISYY